MTFSLLKFCSMGGHGDLSKVNCYCCKLQLPEYKCHDCYRDQLTCGECTWTAHIFSPLYCIQVSSLFEPPCQSKQLTNWYIQWWNEDFFECTNLKALGLRVQLGHLDGSACILIVPAFNDDFVVLDNHSIHDIGIDFCRCGHAQSHIMQLLHYGWYPAMVGQSKTATTSQVLKQFHFLTFESKTSVYKFYCSLAHETNNMATYLVKNHYITFLRMVRQWRHISILKRMGWGHETHDVSATSQGKYTVTCPACPQPGENLPTNWKTTPKEQRKSPLSFICG